MSMHQDKVSTVDRLAIIGAGDLGHSIFRLTKEIPHLNTIGFFDDTCLSDSVHGLPVFSPIDSIEDHWKNNNFDAAIIAIGYKHMRFRSELFTRLKTLNIPFASVVHPSTIIAADAIVGEGSVLFPGCVLDIGVCIGNNCVLNSGVTVAHDSRIDDHTMCGPRVTLAGFTHVQHSCFLGVGTTVIDNIKIEPHVHTGGGTVVIDNLPGNYLYVGVPARPLKSIPTT
ncbi:NeuD/PglB/VioB family sugar acetyltransferase [uncultured Gimesia sp.]|jgi:sugar O-acyltransferase (sialic acid O-acetyltransferase NeuD family)|uniref:NeuD/PglB/VioB family sugar acetyltransferase n=1 Tax=uncultured Gimesia sp. TaxID=1678688 RepID=UPI0026107CC4|nr:NeuD/PglB/VioB family sugar acetyltransferase [uncultured Gimesia sp.]